MLIVGVGAGVTAGALSIHPGVERIVVCEIEPMVPLSARAYFGNENHHVFDDPRVQLVFDDARHFLQTTNEKFDIITSDPIHPWVRGAATLYSLEYLDARAESPHARRGRHAVDPAVRDRPALGKERDRHFCKGVPRHDVMESGSARGRLRPGRARTRRASADQRGALQARLDAAPRVKKSLEEVMLKSAGDILALMRVAAGSSALAGGRARSIGSGICGCSIWRDWRRTRTSGS